MVGDNDMQALKGAVDNFAAVWNSAWNAKSIPVEVEKKYVSKGGPSVYGLQTRVIETFETNTSDFVDMNWMSAYTVENLSGMSSAEIEDFRTLITWAEIGQGKKIEPGPYGDSTATQLREKRYATAVAFLNRWLETNARHNINRAMSMMMLKLAEFKSDQGYTDIASGTIANTAAGGATPALVISGINEGCRELLEGLDTAGFSVSDQTPIVLYARTNHRALIEQAFNGIRGEDGTNETIFNNITRYYTINSNLPTQVNPGAGLVDCCYLVVPGRKNVWGSFKPLTSNQESEFRSDSVIVAMQEYWNKVSADNQKRTVTFA